MDTPLQIAFKDMQSSEFLEGLIRERVARLEHFHGHIVSCRVVVETPHRSAKGVKPALGIAVEVSVPGANTLVAKEVDQRRDSKMDLAGFVNRAFEHIERQLADRQKIQRGAVKAHEANGETGRVIRLFPEQNYGFIEVAGAPYLYFTRNAVLGTSFDDLTVGAMVRVTLATIEGPMGPQASSVRPVGDMSDVV
jgi:hypothetical protein